MRVSRPTFGRILAAAHRKVAEALAHGMTLKIEGGAIRMERPRSPRCECPRCRRPDGLDDAGERSATMEAEAPPCRRMRRRMGCRNIRIEVPQRTPNRQGETS
jgi:hypothetical protein